MKDSLWRPWRRLTLRMKSDRLSATPARFIRWTLCIAAAATAALCATPAHAKTKLKVSLNAAAMDAFNNWTGGGSWAEIKSFKNGNATRPVVDLVLQLQALKAGGLDFDVELVRELTYELAKQAVIDGRADLTAETIWDDEISANEGALLHSDAILQKGEFVKGVYVLPTNEKLLKTTSAADLSGATAAVVSSWALDVKTDDAMSLKGVKKAATPEIVFASIKRGDADFVLEEFSSQPDMSVTRGGVKLIPIPGVKVGLVGSRSWVVSKKSADADAVYKALIAGAKKLADDGTIKRAYTESGFFNPKVADWKPLN
jgi:hypothetical protein